MSTLIVTAMAILILPGAANEVLAQLPDPDTAPVHPRQPARVFILAGQSNMQAHAHISTFAPMAMAAPAALPEFKGNVSAVLTEKYWDMDVVELREREKKIKPKVGEINKQMKEGKLTREKGKAALERLYAGTFTTRREMDILKKSTSNFDFHYMGSARIVAQIGKGFAEAMVEMMEGQKHR